MEEDCSIQGGNRQGKPNEANGFWRLRPRLSAGARDGRRVTTEAVFVREGPEGNL